MIVGIAGRAYSGKDTVGEMFIERGFMRTAFADALKEGVSSVFGLTHDQLHGDLKDVVDDFWNDTPRNILQKFGTECLRQGYRDDIWVKCVERHIKASNKADWIITDVRFPNEVEAVRKLGGFVIRINRPGTENAIATNQHASETALDSYTAWDAVIENNGTIEDLRRKALEVIQNFKETL